jgi:hypothetical protein
MDSRASFRTWFSFCDTIRITTDEHAAATILLPKLTELLLDYPDIKVEIIVDFGLITCITRAAASLHEPWLC